MATASPPRLPPTPPLLFFFLFFFPLLLQVQAAVVTHLPGFQGGGGALPFYLETGYVEVDEANGGEYFYYFIESEGNPAEDPLLLWLTGGPRCSAFSGLAFEIGPLKFVITEYNGSLPSLVYFPTSWTKVANIIFLDSPLGTGFSFVKNYNGYKTNDTYWSIHSHQFLLKWLNDHPKYLSNPLYIAGDSYAGKIVPIVAQQILDGIDGRKQPRLNLKGYIIGNPITGEQIDEKSKVAYALSMGIISDDFFESTQRSCRGQAYKNPSTEQCGVYLNMFDDFLSEINQAHILERKCYNCDFSPPKNQEEEEEESRRRIMKEKTNLGNPPAFPDIRCRCYVNALAYHWANDPDVRKALHTKEGTKSEWIRCQKDSSFTKDIKSSIKYQLNLLSRGYRALVYSGDHDITAPFSGTKIWIKYLNSSIVDDWRSWHVDGQVAGYTTRYSNNLTFVTLKGGGHTAPQYKPKECLAMLKRWTSHQPI